MKSKLCNLKAVYKEISHFESNIRKITGHSVSELLIMCTLSHEKSTTSALASEMGVTPGRISKIISNLENQKLILREIGVPDKRNMYFSLTETGNALMSKMKKMDLSIPEIVIKHESN